MAVTVPDFGRMKVEGTKISMLTAYDYSTAKLVDRAGIDAILVGDSLGNVMLGYDSTTRVTMANMITYGAAVCRGVKNALVIVDMPFMSYHTSDYDAVVNAGRLVQETGCAAVKLEGGVERVSTIEAIVRAQIPVCGHVGLTPQSVNLLGGHKVQGKTLDAARKLIDDLKAVEQAGAFAAVVEGVPAPLAALASRTVAIPTIGIGAGAGCDGQVLVNQDMLGLFDDFIPKFVKHFAQVGEVMVDAYRTYDAQVKDGSFPEPERSYAIDAEVVRALAAELGMAVDAGQE